MGTAAVSASVGTLLGYCRCRALRARAHGPVVSRSGQDGRDKNVIVLPQGSTACVPRATARWSLAAIHDFPLPSLLAREPYASYRVRFIAVVARCWLPPLPLPSQYPAALGAPVCCGLHPRFPALCQRGKHHL